jgi:hypothetical protein
VTDSCDYCTAIVKAVAESEPLTRAEILDSVRDPEWQRRRITMIGLPTEDKLHHLILWLSADPDSQRRHVQVINYVNALKRSGHLDAQGRIAKP